MATADDVAAFIVGECGPMPATKLQKLVYYSYAWHLLWDEDRLFDEQIEAWVNGPVVRELYNEHRGRFMIDEWPRGDAGALTASERETVRAVLEYYGDRTPAWLSELTHRERPWLVARGGWHSASVVTGPSATRRWPSITAPYSGSSPRSNNGRRDQVVQPGRTRPDS